MFSITLTSFSVLMLYAAYSDLRSYTLPNFISILLVAGIVIIGIFLQPSLSVVGWHIGVAALMFAIGFGMFAAGMVGGGDVKVIAALGLWMGPGSILSFFMVMALLGGVLALLLLLFRNVKIPETWLQNGSIRGLYDKGEGIPYGVAIAAAALYEFPQTALYEALAV